MHRRPMRGEDSFEQPGPSGKAVAWACRQAIAWGVVAAIVYWVVAQWGVTIGAAVKPPAPARIAPVAAAVTPAAGASVTNAMRYSANERGEVRLDADVDGAIVHFVVDTGANFVTLTPADAEAAGINPAALVYSMRFSTANGETRGAPIRLRGIRLGQLSVDDVQAVVVPNVSVSLLGMSFLSRLDHWEMHGGVLTISY